MSARRFAEDTKVSVGQSQGEVKDLLKRAGAGRTAIYEDERGSAVMFEIGSGMYRIEVPIPQGKPKPDQEERRAWRLMLLLIKAKLEAVREGATTIEREFLADRLLYDGRTVGAWAERELAEAARIGQMPATFLLTGPSGS